MTQFIKSKANDLAISACGMHGENLLTNVTAWQRTIVENYIVFGEDYRCSGVALVLQADVDARVEFTHEPGKAMT